MEILKEAEMSFLSFQINGNNSELINKNGSIIYRHKLAGIMNSGSICLVVTKFINQNGSANIKCFVNLSVLSNNTISSSSNVVFGYPNPLTVNQTKEQLLSNCSRIRHNIYVYGRDYYNVLDICFFTDNNTRKGIDIGKDWLIQVNVVRPEKINVLPKALPENAKKDIAKYKIDKSYNDKKPSYMKDDLIKIAINKNIIGATRFTIPLLEESLIKSLEGNTLREKALKNKLNVDNDVNDRGLTIALMEFLTGKLK